MTNFNIRFLDHVALMVTDLETSANWYVENLGLTKYTKAEWGPFPVFLLAGKSGLALFPAKQTKSDNETRPSIRLDHVAFNVDGENFTKARRFLESRGIKTTFRDHTFFHSIYFNDPDGHQVELTTCIGEESHFYNNPDGL